MKRRVLVALAAAGMMLGVAGCGGDGNDTPAPEGATESIKIGYIAAGAGAPPDVIAEEKGFFKKHGLEVERVNTNNGPGLVNLVLAGGVDVSWAPTSNTLAATEKVVIVAKNLGSTGFALIQKKGVDDARAAKGFPDSLKELSNPRIGVSVTGSYAEILAKQMLVEAGVDPNSATYVSVGVDATALGALRSNQIDLLITSTLPAAKAIAGGDAVRVASSREIPRLAALPEGVYIVKRDASEAHLAKVKKYLEAIEEADNWAHDPKNSDELGTLLTTYLKVDGDVAEAVKKEWLPGEGNQIGQFSLTFDPQGYESMNEMLVDAGLLPAPVPFEKATNLLMK